MSKAQVAAVVRDVAGEAAPPRAFATGEAQDRERLREAKLRSLPRLSRLGARIHTLRGAGPRLAAAAAEMGIETVGDLLWHVPHTYRDRASLSEVAELKIDEEATVLVEVRSARLRPTRRRNLTILEARVADESGPMKAVWFNQAYVAERLAPGTRLLLHGKLDRRVGFKVSAHELLPLGADVSGVTADGGGRGESGRGAGRRPEARGVPPGLHTLGIVPVHPASEGIRPQRLREWAFQAQAAVRHVIEPLPARVRAGRGLPGAADALAAVHFPASWDEVADARARLAFEELLLHQAALAARRRTREGDRLGERLDPPGELVGRWLASLQFELTGDQRRATEEIDADLHSERPMQRLLMGEVGAGKTAVALYAMLRAVESGFQAALMAPTETLAEQHAHTLERLLAGAGLPSAALLTSSTSPGRRRELLGELADGRLGLVVGTHALIEPSVAFSHLAVAVVDEQHRFGVRQRAALDAHGPDGRAPHALHMTATPIPRTLSLTAYGDLDATVLRELPAGRGSVKTWIAGEEKRAGAYEYVRKRLREGRQAYVVCPLVVESEKLQARAATEEAERLARTEFRDFEVDVLHGQMPAADKGAAMGRFASGRTHVLVATSVIEVGIDVANAAVMVIEAADRYGLSQLHQLRGRVGRGPHPSACILFADPVSEAARLRLEAIERERDGFRLAEIDLALRGEGEILGTRQHGLPRFRVARLPEDADLLTAARDELVGLLRRHGSLEAPELGPLIDAARDRFGDEAAEPIPA